MKEGEERTIDLSNIAEYKENNQLEVKKLQAVYRRVFGKPILLSSGHVTVREVVGRNLGKRR